MERDWLEALSRTATDVERTARALSRALEEGAVKFDALAVTTATLRECEAVLTTTRGALARLERVKDVPSGSPGTWLYGARCLVEQAAWTIARNVGQPGRVVFHTGEPVEEARQLRVAVLALAEEVERAQLVAAPFGPSSCVVGRLVSVLAGVVDAVNALVRTASGTLSGVDSGAFADLDHARLLATRAAIKLVVAARQLSSDDVVGVLWTRRPVRPGGEQHRLLVDALRPVGTWVCELYRVVMAEPIVEGRGVAAWGSTESSGRLHVVADGLRAVEAIVWGLRASATFWGSDAGARLEDVRRALVEAGSALATTGEWLDRRAAMNAASDVPAVVTAASEAPAVVDALGAVFLTLRQGWAEAYGDVAAGMEPAQVAEVLVALGDAVQAFVRLLHVVATHWDSRLPREPADVLVWTAHELLPLAAARLFGEADRQEERARRLRAGSWWAWLIGELRLGRRRANNEKGE